MAKTDWTRKNSIIVRVVIVRVVLVLAVLTSILASTSAPASARDGGITFANDTVYEVNPETGKISVIATITVTNVTANTTGGNYIQQYYWSSLTTPLPANAEDLTITNGSGSPLSWEPVEDDEFPSEDVTFASISFGRNLFYRQTATIVVSYNLTDAEPRSEELTRINSAYAAFGAYGIGDPGMVNLTVIVPANFAVDTIGSRMTSRTEGDKRIYEAVEIEDPYEFFVFVSARNDDALITRDVSYDTGTIAIHHWPGDNEWADFMTERIEVDLPIMSKLVGMPFPDEKLEIIETISPALYGYGGWYDTSSSLIEVTEDLDSHLALHEISHGWFNDKLFTDRFITEGLAEEYAARTIAESGGELLDPDQPAPVLTDARKLNNWGDLAVGDDDAELYGYTASWWVMRQLTDEIGIDSLSLVLQAAAENKTAYVGDEDAESVDATDDWKRFLDLLEEVGESTEATAIFEEWVATGNELPLLEERTETRLRYESLEDAGDSWAPPLVVREQMSDWSFAEASDSMAIATDAIESRDRIIETLAATETALPSKIEGFYESAAVGDLDRLMDRMVEYEASSAAVADAHDALTADRNVIETVGSWLADDELTFDDAQAEFEDDASAAALTKANLVTANVAEYQTKGTIRIAGSVAVLIVLIAGAWFFRSRRKNRRSAVLDLEPEAAPLPNLPEVESLVGGSAL